MGGAADAVRTARAALPEDGAAGVESVVRAVRPAPCPARGVCVLRRGQAGLRCPGAGRPWRARINLAGRVEDGVLEVLCTQSLPDSLGMVYEELTADLGFQRASDEYKVMAMASYGRPRFLDALRQVIRTTGEGGFLALSPDFAAFAPALSPGGDWTPAHADLACSVQRRLEEVLLAARDGRWGRAELRGECAALGGGAILRGVGSARGGRARRACCSSTTAPLGGPRSFGRIATRTPASSPG